jgi:hypothetical protein
MPKHVVKMKDFAHSMAIEVVEEGEMTSSLELDSISPQTFTSEGSIHFKRSLGKVWQSLALLG